MGSNNYDGQIVNISNVSPELTEYLQVLLAFPVMVPSIPQEKVQF